MMRLVPKANIWRKGALLYRGLRYRRGYGVHSPFVFNLITKVIEEKCSYYSFYDIELLRRELYYREDKLPCPDRSHPGRMKYRQIGEIVYCEAIKPSHGKLLFRLANYFKSQRILQIGPNVGISTLYLTSYAKEVRCIALENVPQFAEIARQVFERAGKHIDLRVGSYASLLPQALRDLGEVDLVYFNTLYEQQHTEALFESCLPYVGDWTLFVFEGIKSSQRMRAFWDAVCARPEVTVTIDLYTMGIVFFNPKLHKQNYIVYF